MHFANRYTKFQWSNPEGSQALDIYEGYISLRWRRNGRDSVSNHQLHDCLLNRLFRRRSKKTSKLRVTGLCVGNSPGTGEFPTQMASNAENVSIWWRHHVTWIYYYLIVWLHQLSTMENVPIFDGLYGNGGSVHSHACKQLSSHNQVNSRIVRYTLYQRQNGAPFLKNQVAELGLDAEVAYTYMLLIERILCEKYLRDKII